MNYVSHVYPVLLLAFSVWLQYVEQNWFSIGVFVVSALCWFAALGEFKNKNSWEDEL